jgi:hypothetical protein
MNFYKLHKLLNEYSQNLVQSLIIKFKEQKPGLTSTIIQSYIDRFERIKNNLPEKDITKLSWKELESTVDGYQGKNKIKAGKLDPTIKDANLLVNKDGIRIYLGKDKKSCIRYSNGYTFCIGTRGEENMYSQYRIHDQGTPYFIFNDNLSKEDERHIIVLFVYQHRTKPNEVRYTVTLAKNSKDEEYDNLKSLLKKYPWIAKGGVLVNTLEDPESKGVVHPNFEEYMDHYLETAQDYFNSWFIMPVDREGFNWEDERIKHLIIISLKYLSPQKIKQFLEKEIDYVYIKLYAIMEPTEDEDEHRRPNIHAKNYNLKTILDDHRYFGFFTVNKQETIKNIAEKLKYIIDDYDYLKKNKSEIIQELHKKADIIQKIIKEGPIPTNDKLEQLKDIDPTGLKDWGFIEIPYLVISIKNIKNHATKLINDNIDHVNDYVANKEKILKIKNFMKNSTQEETEKFSKKVKSSFVGNPLASNKELYRAWQEFGINNLSKAIDILVNIINHPAPKGTEFLI